MGGDLDTRDESVCGHKAPTLEHVETITRIYTLQRSQEKDYNMYYLEPSYIRSIYIIIEYTH